MDKKKKELALSNVLQYQGIHLGKKRNLLNMEHINISSHSLNISKNLNFLVHVSRDESSGV
jgi:hypothetical protein